MNMLKRKLNTLLNSSKADTSGYISDGLVFMLDGYDAPMNGCWIDRMEGCAGLLNVNNTYDSVNKCYKSTASSDNCITFMNRPLVSDKFTFEVVFKFDHDNTTSGTSARITYGDPFQLFRSGAGHINYNFAKTGSAGFIDKKNLDLSKIHNVAVTRDLDTDRYIRPYWNGGADDVTVTWRTIECLDQTVNQNLYLFNTMYLNSPMIGNIYALRIYNRKLTDYERLFNYQNDRTRFHF